MECKEDTYRLRERERERERERKWLQLFYFIE